MVFVRQSRTHFTHFSTQQPTGYILLALFSESSRYCLMEFLWTFKSLGIYTRWALPILPIKTYSPRVSLRTSASVRPPRLSSHRCFNSARPSLSAGVPVVFALWFLQHRQSAFCLNDRIIFLVSGSGKLVLSYAIVLESLVDKLPQAGRRRKFVACVPHEVTFGLHD